MTAQHNAEIRFNRISEIKNLHNRKSAVEEALVKIDSEDISDSEERAIYGQLLRNEREALEEAFLSFNIAVWNSQTSEEEIRSKTENLQEPQKIYLGILFRTLQFGDFENLSNEVSPADIVARFATQAKPPVSAKLSSLIKLT